MIFSNRLFKKKKNEMGCELGSICKSSHCKRRLIVHANGDYRVKNGLTCKGVWKTLDDLNNDKNKIIP